MELPRLAPPGVRLYAKLEGANPTGSVKDRVAKAMVEAAEARGELEPGRELLEPTSGNTGISLALVAKLKGYRLTCVVPANATAERLRLLELYGARIITTPAEEGSNGAVREALRLAESDPKYAMLNQYGNEANPRAHYDGTGAEIADALPHVDALVAGLGTGGTLMGAGERLREAFPGITIAAAEPLQGDLVYGLRSLDDGYTPPILDVSKLDRKILVTTDESIAGTRALLDGGRDLRGRLLRRGRARRAAHRRGDGLGNRRLRPRRRRLEVPVRAVLADRRRGRLEPLVVIGAEVRSALAEHAEAERPNEACGLIALRDGVAERYIPGRNAEPSPYRFQLEVDPETWFLEDEGYELAVFHSHLASPPRPSRTDVENIGLWEGPPVRDPQRPDRRAARLADRRRPRRARCEMAGERPPLEPPALLETPGDTTGEWSLGQGTLKVRLIVRCVG